MRELAQREHVHCKLSGMVTEATGEHWQEPDLRPCFDVALQAFGPERLMFGSDWRPCCWGAYSRWANIVRSWIAPSRPESRTPFFRKVHAGPIPYEGSRAANPASLLISQ
ncbi:MAG: amidohydrolase family protein [Acidobacteria bacterium]|nr:amidohydrolase family protein [Acidobacteriota bacterium]